MVHDTIARLKAEGIGIFLISHDMPDVFEVCDRATRDEERQGGRHRAASPDVTAGRGAGDDHRAARRSRVCRSVRAGVTMRAQRPPLLALLRSRCADRRSDAGRCRASSTRPMPPASRAASTAKASTSSAAAWPPSIATATACPSLFITGGVNKAQVLPQQERARRRDQVGGGTRRAGADQRHRRLPDRHRRRRQRSTSSCCVSARCSCCAAWAAAASSAPTNAGASSAATRWHTAFAADLGARRRRWPTLAHRHLHRPRASPTSPGAVAPPASLCGPRAGEALTFDAPLPLTPGALRAVACCSPTGTAAATPALRISNDREYYKGGQEQLWHVAPGAAPRALHRGRGLEAAADLGHGHRQRRPRRRRLARATS